MKKAKFLVILPIIALIVSIFAGCNQSPAPASSTAESSTAPVSSTQAGNVNILTGVDNLSEAAVGKRPVAVMINNVAESLPQYGISEADIMVETLVEYGITRMMALYGDYTKIPNVCSIRSCRYYFPQIAMGFDAIYLHCGIDQVVAAPMIAEMGIDHIDSDEAIFQRDQDRLNQGYALEHTMFLIGSKVPEYLKEKGINTELSSDKKGTAFKFNSVSDPKQPDNGTNKCTEVNLVYSEANGGTGEDTRLDYWSTFTYDEGTKTYLKQHNGKAHMDEKANKQLAYTNVIVLETDIHLRSDSEKLMDVDTTGSSVGKGYYISNGAYQKITWSKPSNSSYIKLMDENGNEISINAGKSYIGFINANKTTIK